MRAEDIATEVFFFPAAAHTEKEGSFTNTQRLLQWRHKAIDPPADPAANCTSYSTWAGASGICTRTRRSQRPRGAGPDLELSDSRQARRTDAEAILKEINGYTLSDGKAVSGFTDIEG